MTFTKTVLVLACLMSTTLVAQEAKVAPLMSKDLAECPGKEGVMITVEYPRAIRTKYIATTPMCLFMCWKARS